MVSRVLAVVPFIFINKPSEEEIINDIDKALIEGYELINQVSSDTKAYKE